MNMFWRAVAEELYGSICAINSNHENHLTYIFLSNRVYPNAENNRLVKMNIRTDLQEVVYKALQK